MAKRPEPVVDDLVEATMAQTNEGPICRANQMGCQLPPGDNGQFCNNHWKLIPLDMRGTLLAYSARDASPLGPNFNSALTKALDAIRKRKTGR